MYLCYSVKRMGAARKRASEGMTYFGARIPKSTRRELERYAGRKKLSASAAAALLLEEGLRMERFPGIDFRWTPSGRKAHVTATGLSAWEVHLLWKSYGGRMQPLLRDHPGLTASQVQAAVAYMEMHPEEMPSFERPSFARPVRV